MVEHRGLIHRAGVVIQAACNGQVDLKVVSRHAEGLHVLRNGFQLVRALVEHLVLALVALERREDALGAARDLDEREQLVRRLACNAEIVAQDGFDLFRADLFQLVDRAHHVARLFGQAEDGEKAV